MDLQVQQHHTFQRSEWRWVRVGWAAMAALIAAGLLGLLGPGPASWVSAEGAGGLVTVDYQRFTHHESDDSITLQIAATTSQNRELSVDLTGQWLSGVDLQSIQPEPAEQRPIPDGVNLRWPMTDAANLTVQLHFRPQEYGLLEGAVAVPADRVAFAQYVLP